MIKTLKKSCMNDLCKLHNATECLLLCHTDETMFSEALSLCLAHSRDWVIELAFNQAQPQSSKQHLALRDLVAADRLE